jgi:glucose-1-phosphate adenylyltransferase
VRNSEIARNTFGIVLAGGRGSRLMQLTDWRSKPAVPFGGKFRIIDFTLSNCVNSGIRRIGVATQYKAQSLIQHLQRGWSFLDGRFHEFIDILPAQQQVGEDWYQGTADAVFQNLDLIRRNRPKHVLVLSGDHIYKMDYGRMLAEHAERQADFSVACIDVPRPRPANSASCTSTTGSASRPSSRSPRIRRRCRAARTAPWPAWACMSSMPTSSTSN